MWAVIVGYVVVGGLALLLTLATGPFPVTKTGTVGEWMAGLGAVLAVSTALLIATREDDRHENTLWRGEAAAWVTDARRVTVAYHLLVEDDLDEVYGDPSGGYTLYMVISNHSANPIRAVRLVLDWASPDVSSDGGDARTPFFKEVMAPLEVSGPEAFGVFRVPAGESLSQEDLTSYGVRFIDVHGDEWIVRFGRALGNSRRTS